MKNTMSTAAEEAAQEMLQNLWSEADDLIEDTFHSYEEIVRNCVRLDVQGDIQELALNESSQIQFYTMKEDSVQKFIERFSDIVYKNAEVMAERLKQDLETQST